MAWKMKSDSYTYDLHGWLKSITTNSFAEELFYADGPGTKLYNGNISSMRWKNGSYSSVKRGYKFTYDTANRLTNAVYGEKDDLKTNVNRFNEKIAYDKNGNITRMTRRAVLDIVPKLLDDVFRKYVLSDVAHYDDVELAPVVVLYRPSAGLGLPERTRRARILEKLRLDAVD